MTDGGMQLGCSYVIAFRADDHGQRLSNLTAVIRHISHVTGLDIIVVEQDSQPRLSHNELSGFTAASGVSIRHAFLKHSGSFNKSWAMNVGFRQAVAPVVAFGDADVLVPTSALETAIAGVTSGNFDATTPFDRIVDLDIDQSAAMCAGAPLPSQPANLEQHRRGEGEYLPFCGGLFVISQTAFSAAGGFDECFSGWGAEDDALSVKLHRMGFRLGINTGRACFHLWHERATDRYQVSEYEKNLTHLKFLQECTNGQFAEHCAEAVEHIGNPQAPWCAPNEEID